jgi:hypothetical protein
MIHRLIQIFTDRHIIVCLYFISKNKKEKQILLNYIYQIL